MTDSRARDTIDMTDTLTPILRLHDHLVDELGWQGYQPAVRPLVDLGVGWILVDLVVTRTADWPMHDVWDAPHIPAADVVVAVNNLSNADREEEWRDPFRALQATPIPWGWLLDTDRRGRPVVSEYGRIDGVLRPIRVRRRRPLRVREPFTCEIDAAALMAND